MQGTAVRVNLFYLHGFASSPTSTKGAFFSRHLAEHGLKLHCPDLNVPDFGTVTVSGMIAEVEKQILAEPAAPTAIIGSSLGALVAIELASRWCKQCAVGRAGDVAAHPIDRLVLLAPALDFVRNRQRHLGPNGVEQWKREGSLEVFHYGEGRPRRVHYGLYEDARRYDPYSAYLDFPILVFHGRHDEVVDPASVEAFARSRPNVRLRMLDDDHQLLKSLDEIWRETAEFLGLEGPR